MPRILVVEDEEKLRRAMHRGLEEQGFTVVSVENGDLGWTWATKEAFDCIVLDRLLPGRDGLRILGDLRAAGVRVPTLVVTALSEVERRVEGLDAGADDYLTKPFEWAEFLARVRSCVRRGTANVSGVLSGKSFRLDCVHRKLLNDVEQIDLTDRECELLEYLMRRANTTVTRDELAREVWRESEFELTNIVDVYIARLRKRLDKIGAPDRIKTVRGSGYCFEE